MSKIPVSVCIIAKNEEKHIENCLSRLKPYGFEIVVTDTGSTDRTKEIAQKYADKVLDFEWIDDFAAARNFCVSHAENDWILSLDCDEYVSSIDLEQLLLNMLGNKEKTGVLRLTNLFKNQKGEDSYSSDDLPRMFHRDYYTFIFPIHEQIRSVDPALRKGVMPSFMLPMEVIHHGYNISDEEMAVKNERNLRLLYKRLEEDPDDVYTLFQIGQSERINPDKNISIDFYERALSHEHNVNILYVQTCIIALATCYLEVGRNQDALDLMNRYAGKINTAKFVFSHGSVYANCDQPLKALLMYIKTTAMPDVDTIGEHLTECYDHIIEIYTLLGQPDMAELFRDRYEKCVKERERILNA